MNIFLFLGLCFLLFFMIGPLMEKLRVPWIFAALLVGLGLAVYNPFPEMAKAPAFDMLANLGMYFLLFIIGLEIDLYEMKKLGKIIAKTTAVITVLGTLFGTLLIHYAFGTGWLIAGLVAMSFNTVGEAILVPILDEFKIIHTRLGQAILGVATLDDVIELASLIWLSVLLGTQGEAQTGLGIELAAFGGLVVLTIVLILIKRYIPKIKIPNYSGIVLCFMLVVLFIYLGIGQLAGMEALAAILAGLVTKYFVSKEQFELLETHIKLLTYGFLAPIFFLKVGMQMNMGYLVSNLWLVLLVTLVSSVTKLLSTWLTTRKEFGTKKSILMGIALSVRFSTSIVIVSILYQHNIIGNHLFSVLIASSVVFIFIPAVFSNLLVKWGVAFKPE